MKGGTMSEDLKNLFSKKNNNEISTDSDKEAKHEFRNLLFNSQFRYRESTRTIFEWKENRKTPEELHPTERKQ
jgi:hypothetical protein